MEEHRYSETMVKLFEPYIRMGKSMARAFDLFAELYKKSVVEGSVAFIAGCIGHRQSGFFVVVKL